MIALIKEKKFVNLHSLCTHQQRTHTPISSQKNPKRSVHMADASGPWSFGHKPEVLKQIMSNQQIALEITPPGDVIACSIVECSTVIERTQHRSAMVSCKLVPAMTHRCIYYTQHT